ncbi:hypothetical protein DPMN_141348 [Dreissena polymorpha]|uniref:Uncharacterized protein n=1 Tax=Dreissena polymorpha TaxID=45954 RepID=A0A9D4G9A9_DREPO|nr:hypothetical protein DPMN_141348 [Dreissena polymorpha]
MPFFLHLHGGIKELIKLKNKCALLPLRVARDATVCSRLSLDAAGAFGPSRERAASLPSDQLNHTLGSCAMREAAISPQPLSALVRLAGQCPALVKRLRRSDRQVKALSIEFTEAVYN